MATISDRHAQERHGAGPDRGDRAAPDRAPCPISTSRSSSSKPRAISTRPASCCRMAARAARSWRKSALRCCRANCTRRCIRSRTCRATRTRPGLVIGATLSRDPPGDALVLRPGAVARRVQARARQGIQDRHQRRAARGLCAAAVSGRRDHPLSRRRRHPRAQARQWRNAAAAGRRRGRSGGRADHGALRARARRACRPHRL